MKGNNKNTRTKNDFCDLAHFSFNCSITVDIQYYISLWYAAWWLDSRTPYEVIPQQV